VGDWGSKERLFCICIGSSFASEWSEHGVLALGVRDSMGMRVIVDFLLVAFFLKQATVLFLPRITNLVTLVGYITTGFFGH